MPDSLPWDQLTNHNRLCANSAETVLVIGAGLAGCWMARTLAEKGFRVTVLEAGNLPASGASANPAGIVKPFVTRSPGFAMEFYVQAHQYLLQKLSDWNLIESSGFKACGVVQLVKKPYPESEHYRCLSQAQMKEVLGTQCDAYGLLFEQSGWLNPSALCNSLLQHALIDVYCHSKIEAVTRKSDASWEIVNDKQRSWRSNHWVVSTGAALTRLPLIEHLPITPARGQISRFNNTPQTASIKRVISGRHYLIPDTDSVIVGATFNRGVSDDTPLAEDDQSNLHGVNTMLPELHLTSGCIEAYAGVRATTPDRMPLVGPIPDAKACQRAYADLHHGRNVSAYPALPCHAGANILGGLGSRGIVTAPFSAMLLADYLTGGHQLSHWSALVNPARFQIRELKRTRVS